MSQILGCNQHSLFNCTQCREKEILESLREELADFKQRDERANDRLMEEVALARSWMNKFDARQNKVNELEGNLAESKRRETELGRKLNAQLQNMAIECGEAQGQLKRKREEVDQLTAHSKTLEDALDNARSVAEDFRHVIVQVYPDATRQDNPYYQIRNHMAAMLRVLDTQALAAKESKNAEG